MTDKAEASGSSIVFRIGRYRAPVQCSISFDRVQEENNAIRYVQAMPPLLKSIVNVSTS